MLESFSGCGYQRLNFPYLESFADMSDVETAPAVPPPSSGDTAFSWSVFISYSHEDKVWVREVLMAQLKLSDLKVCIDDDDFVPGVPAIENMERAVEHSRHVLLVLTPNWVNSEWAGFESLLATTADPAGRRRRVLPVMLKRCEPPPHIRFLTYVDFTDPARQSQEMGRLLKAMSASVPVQELFPARSERATVSARNGFLVLAELANQPEVLPQVVRYRVIFEQTRQQSDRLRSYKRLHDRLHELERFCYNLLLQDAKRFPEDESAMESLRDHEITLETNVRSLTEIVDGVAYLDSERTWILQLDAARQLLREATESANPEKLRQTIRAMRNVFGLQPALINKRLTEAAQSMQLTKLAEAMTELCEKLSGSSSDKAKLIQFQEGVNALGRLSFALEVLVRSHDGWQVADNEMRRIETELEREPEELSWSWQDLKKMTDALCARSLDSWADSLKEDAGQVQRAIEARNPAGMKTNFHRFCLRAAAQFYQVDIALLNLCGDLGSVGEPLDAILRAIT
jgi:hypothetical protein